MATTNGLSGYQKIIAEGSGCSPDEAEKLENIIRVRHPTLDHLTRQELLSLARTAYAVYKADPSLGDC